MTETTKAPLREAAAAALAVEASDAAYALRELAIIGCARDIAPAMAAEVKPRGLLERAIVHQAATAHALAMRLASRADSWAGRAEQDFRLGNTPLAQASNVEAARMATAASRLMATVTDAALALDRLRYGGRQQVTVRHMTVSHGGQAVIAGTVEGGRRRAGGRRRGSPSE
jgi:hypothetical protein